MPQIEKDRSPAVISPELLQLIRAMEKVTEELPRIMRAEKKLAFSRLDRVDDFEFHMRKFDLLPVHLELLAKLLGETFQVGDSPEKLSRILRNLANRKMKEAPKPPLHKNGVDGRDVDRLMSRILEEGEEIPAAEKKIQAAEAPILESQEESLEILKPEAPSIIISSRAPGIMDLTLDSIRNTLVPGGAVCGRSMYESSRARLVTARASGDEPWRFHFRVSSLEWARAAAPNGMRGMVALICDDRGYFVVDPDRLLSVREGYFTRSTGGNLILRPTVTLLRNEAILHPGAIRDARHGEVSRHTFVDL